ncbi:hypothetical protein DERP_007673 [Dermatophagoides pteronyssinus]|uniref:Uncharacterized protein n=1 Tax=Dermatophagoides pteronyssinus TaxID=6956 RepID=A0ABQ8JKE2_DERPT|nr:hypothetical protein DERP_007673 [Dermatophagoides pteronyssinus]
MYINQIWYGPASAMEDHHSLIHSQIMKHSVDNHICLLVLSCIQYFNNVSGCIIMKKRCNAHSTSSSSSIS